MRRVIEALALVVPLPMSAVFLVAAFAMPFGDAADRSQSTLYLAALLFLLSVATGAHLICRNAITSIFGVLFGSAALIAFSCLFAEQHLLGSSGYWQIIVVIVSVIAVCGWHRLDKKSSPTEPF